MFSTDTNKKGKKSCTLKFLTKLCLTALLCMSLLSVGFSCFSFAADTDASLCIESECWLEFPDYYDFSDNEINYIQAGMEYFYKKTGIQPYLMLTPQADGEFEDGYYQSLMENRYSELFTDEGHLILLYGADCLDNGYAVLKGYYGGENTKSLLTDGAMSCFHDAENTHFTNLTGFSRVLRNMFLNAADSIMTSESADTVPDINSYMDDLPDEFVDGENAVIVGSEETYIPLPIALAIVAGFAVLFVGFILIMTHVGKKPRKNSKYDNPHAPAESSKPTELFSDRKSGSYPSYGNKEAQNYPVTCPKCKATAYLTEDGCCQYCGLKLR